MAGSKPQTNREKALLAMKIPPPDGYYEWDGKDEDDRPLTKEEMQEGIKQARKKMGRPVGSRKTATTIRLDDEILEAFKATGPGWQTRLNDAVKDWLKTHSPA